MKKLEITDVGQYDNVGNLRGADAIYAAEQVIDIFEDRYPEDKRPREAIQAVKDYLNNPCEENRIAADAYAAAYAAAAADAGAHADACPKSNENKNPTESLCIREIGIVCVDCYNKN